MNGGFIMSMTKCTECGKEISDMAYVCPNCGCPFGDNILPLNDYFHDIKKKKSNEANWSKFGLLIASGIALIFAQMFLDVSWLVQLGVATIVLAIYYIIITYRF